MSLDNPNVLTMITTCFATEQSSAVLEVVEVVGNLKKLQPIQCSWPAVTGLFLDAKASLDLVLSVTNIGALSLVSHATF